MTTKPEVPILTAEMVQLVDCFWPEEQAALDAIANGTAKVVSAERLAELEEREKAWLHLTGGPKPANWIDPDDCEEEP
jgi:hypothetical protein